MSRELDDEVEDEGSPLFIVLWLVSIVLDDEAEGECSPFSIWPVSRVLDDEVECGASPFLIVLWPVSRVLDDEVEGEGSPFSMWPVSRELDDEVEGEGSPFLIVLWPVSRVLDDEAEGGASPILTVLRPVPRVLDDEVEGEASPILTVLRPVFRAPHDEAEKGGGLGLSGAELMTSWPSFWISTCVPFPCGWLPLSAENVPDSAATLLASCSLPPPVTSRGSAAAQNVRGCWHTLTWLSCSMPVFWHRPLTFWCPLQTWDILPPWL